jgi:hypothetical protein
MIRNELLNGSFSDGTYETYMSYKKQTGVLFEYDYTINAEHYYDLNNTDLGRALISQSIEFVVLIPPNIILTNFFSFSTMLILTIIIFLIVFRKRV